MKTLSALLAFCEGNSPVTSEFPSQMPVTRSFDVFFDLHLNKRLNKQSWGWWFEMSSHPSWRHCNGEGNPSVNGGSPHKGPAKKALMFALLLTWTHFVKYRDVVRMVVNSLVPGRFERNFRQVIFERIFAIDGWGISCEMVTGFMPSGNKSLSEPMFTQFYVIIWCHWPQCV